MEVLLDVVVTLLAFHPEAVALFADSTWITSACKRRTGMRMAASRGLVCREVAISSTVVAVEYKWRLDYCLD